MAFDTRTLSGIGVLVAVAEAGNFVRAGEVLGLSPSGVSRAVARLEARVGVRLFDRSPRSVALTEEGQRFHAEVLPLLDSLEEAAGALSGSANAVRGRLRLSIDPWFARMVLAPALPRFLATHPELSLDIATSNHREEMMSGFDVAIRFGPPDGASLIALKLAETPVITCAAPSYLSARGMPASPAEMSRHEAILFRDPQTARPFAWEFGRGANRYEVPAFGQLVLDDPSLAVETCVAGQGIFQSLAMGLAPWLIEGRLIRILSEWSDEAYPLYAYHRSRHRPPAKVRKFLDFARSIAVAAV
jgi:DNA-binding transcriptional LysR family regulator